MVKKKIKALSRTKYYKGEPYKSFTFKLRDGYKVHYLNISVGSDGQCYYEVPSANEDRNKDAQLYVMYANLVTMQGRKQYRKGVYSSYVPRSYGKRY
jgi:hypothetical protein